MDQPDTHLLAKGREESPGAGGPMVKQHRPGDDLPLPHRSDQGANRGACIGIEVEITKDIAARIIIEERELRSGLVQIAQGDFFQEIAVPETVGMVALREAPGRRGEW